MEARQAAKDLREKLLRVIEHAQVTIWSCNLDRELTLLEGKLLYQDGKDRNKNLIGRDVYDVFGEEHSEAQVQELRASIDDILENNGKERHMLIHRQDNDRWYRTRVTASFADSRCGGIEGKSYLNGVVGISVDVTSTYHTGRPIS